jgi:hypothetical protein
MAEDARERGLTLQRAEAQRAFGEMLCDLLVQLRRAPAPAKLREASEFLALGRQLGIEAVSPRAQEQLWELLMTNKARPPELERLAAELGFAPPAQSGPPSTGSGEAENAIDPARRTRPAPRAA